MYTKKQGSLDNNKSSVSSFAPDIMQRNLNNNNSIIIIVINKNYVCKVVCVAYKMRQVVNDVPEFTTVSCPQNDMPHD
jgi:hypothetical protein